MVIRINKTKNYVVMSNEHLRRQDMSLKAKGLLSLMLSLPEEWSYSIEGICSLCQENETAIKSALKELKKHKYLTINKIMPSTQNGGRFSYEYNIYESSHEQEEIQGIEKQGVENQPLEILALENQPYINNNIKQNIEEENIDIINNKKENINTKEKEIVDYLNEKLSTHYRYNSAITQKHIKARLSEGYTVNDFKCVIDFKIKEWQSDPKMFKYLTPDTLFSPKFEKYLNAANIKVERSIEELLELNSEEMTEDEKIKLKKYYKDNRLGELIL